MRMQSVHTDAPGDIPTKPRIGNVSTTTRTFTIRKISGAVNTIEAPIVCITAIRRKCGFRYTTDSGRTTIPKIESTIRVITLIWMSFKPQIDLRSGIHAGHADIMSSRKTSAAV